MHLDQLESESVYILREVVGEFKNPVLLYSAGKDSSVLLRLSQKAFYPGEIPFPLLHIDTGFKFKQMYEFRDQTVAATGVKLIVERNEEWIAKGANPKTLGVESCCGQLKTRALLQALKKHQFDAAIGGARRDEEKSRAKERVFSLRNEQGVWDPRTQRSEIWNLYNCELNPGQSARVFPLSNWTEIDIWEYIVKEAIPVVPLYFAQFQNGSTREGLRYRSLGCTPCTGAIPSGATHPTEILEELKKSKFSERQNRLIDRTSDSAMEEKKREGYF